MRFRYLIKNSCGTGLLLVLLTAGLLGSSWASLASPAQAVIENPPAGNTDSGNSIFQPLRFGAAPGPDTHSVFDLERARILCYGPEAANDSDWPAAAAQAGEASTRWNLKDLYPDNDAWQADCERLEQILIPALAGYEGQLGDPASVLKCLQAMEDVYRSCDRIYIYAISAANLNQADSAASERLSTAISVYTGAITASAFVEPELLAQDPEYLDSLGQKPGLAPYTAYFSQLRLKQDHYLSAEEEALLASALELTQAPESIYTKLTTVDIDFDSIIELDGEETAVSEASYLSLVSDPNRELREQAYQKLMSGYMDNSCSLAAILESQVKANIFYARARNYDSALDAALDSELVPREVYNNLLDSASKNLAPLHRYTRLRACLLDLDRVAACDMITPLAADYNRSFTYSQARGIVLQGLAPLGSEYTERLEYGLNHGWVDVYPANGKISGAYATAIYDSHPFILLNFDGSYDSVLTLAHEAGHAMYFDYANSNQDYMNSSTPIVTQEIASTANELLVIDYLISQADSDDEKLFLSNLLADYIANTFYRQVMYAEFEQQIHQRVEAGEGLSPDSLNEIWSGLLKKYYGPSFQVDEYSAAGWMRIPHFYYNFYVYKYSLDIAAAQQLVTGLLSGEEGRVEAYLNFMKAGSSDVPFNVMLGAGVDLSDPALENALLERFEQALDEIEAISLKQGRLPR